MLGVDALERPVSEARTMQSVVNGSNLVITIDPAFQQQIEVILQRWIDEGERRRAAAEGYKNEYHPITNGVAVVQDVRDGRVLAMVSLPAYDNNIWVDRSRAEELQNLLSPADPERRAELARLAPLTNSAVAGSYPPGSSIKPFVGATALQMGVIQPDTTLRDPGRIVLEERNGNIFVLPNSTRRDNGEINISDALMMSSNVFFASIGGGNDQAKNLGEDSTIIQGLQIDRLAQGLQWFAFGAPTGVPLPGEVDGRVPSPNWKSHTLREPWTTGDTYNASIGQGYLEVTPLQLNVATSAIANNGTVYRPQLVQQVVDSSGVVLEQMQPEMLWQVPVDDGYLDVMHDGMRRSITEGINVAARNACSGLSIAGKTGTAEFGPVIETPEGRLTRQSHAWFTGFAPYENPEIAVTVLLEGTGDLDDGSSTLAVPAVTQVMQAYFGVTPPEDVPPECPELPQ
jgi:penicillin-binding protein 2